MKVQKRPPKDRTKKDALGRMKETRHGTRHFTSWKPSEPARTETRRAKAARGRKLLISTS